MKYILTEQQYNLLLENKNTNRIKVLRRASDIDELVDLRLKNHLHLISVIIVGMEDGF